MQIWKRAKCERIRSELRIQLGNFLVNFILCIMAMTMGYTCIMNMNSKHKICSCIFLYFHVEIRCTHGMGFFFLLSRIFTRCCWYYYFSLTGGRLCARITFIISYIPCNIDGEIHSQFMHSLLNTWILSVPWCVRMFYVEYMIVYCVLGACVRLSQYVYVYFCVWCQTRFVFFIPPPTMMLFP